ncbi:MAG: HAMP domain-containing histidine kinase [Deltaproteobacteria bacterium]|nr:HAMP domain-containing histidine kinase [Deltaproteobacteria bacterium]
MDPKKPKTSDRPRTGSQGEISPDKLEPLWLQQELIRLGTLIMIGRITPEVIHDINNQLTGILGYAELLSMKKVEDPSIKNGLKSIYLSAERCKDLLANLLSFSRQENSLISLADVNEVIEKTIELRSCGLRHQQIGIMKDLGSDIPVIPMDVNQLQRLIMHLVFIAEEALGHRSQEKKIFMHTVFSPQNQAVTIKIKQNGAFISGDLFLQSNLLTGSADLEIGFSIVEIRQLLNELKGSIEIENVEGEGSAFVIHLPVKG